MNIFARLLKAQENSDGTLTIIGRATQEVPDKVNEVFDYEKSMPHFKKWSEEFEKVTDGKSVGNLRSMHGSVAAGKLTEINFMDAEKAIDIKAMVVDTNEVKKTLEGVYTGFSIGGKYLSKWPDTANPKLTRYEAQPAEISLVDSPCLGVARFAIQKMDGTVEEKEFVKREFSQDERDKAADKGQALPDGSFPIKNKDDLKNAVKAYGRAKNKAAAKRHIIKRAKALGATDLLPDGWTKKAQEAEDLIKNFPAPTDKAAAVEDIKKYSSEEIYDVSRAVNALQIIAYLYEQETAEDPLDAEQTGFLQAAIENLKQFIAAEIMEADEDDVITRVELSAFLKGEGTAEELTAFAKLLDEAGVDLFKRGARHSKDDMGKIQTIHDHAAALGAECDASKAHGADDLHKNLTKLEADSDFLTKCYQTVEEAFSKMWTEYDVLKKKYDELPASAKGFAGGDHLAPIITKKQESLGKTRENQEEIDGLEERIKKATSQKQREDVAIEVIKMIHAQKIK
jgi:hypothetical protein